MKGKVLIPQDIAPPGKAYLENNGFEAFVGGGYAPENIIADIVDCDAVIVRNFPFTEEMMLAGNKLRVIARHGVGVDNIDVQAATKHGIQVVFAPMSNAISVAEHVIAFICGAAHQIAYCDREMKKGGFEFRHHLPVSDIAGKTLGVIGFGKIGGLVARKAKLGLDMEVVVYDPFVEVRSDAYKVAGSLEQLLPLCDYITVHIPLNDATRGIIGAKELGQMKRSACLINTARGELIDEAALDRALRDGTIAFACLDVFSTEPVEPDFPLLKRDNTLLTPHSATLTKECLERMGTHAAKGIVQVLTGQQPTWPVNLLTNGKP